MGDLEYWRRMPFRTFVAWHKFATLQAVNRRLKQAHTGG